MGEKSSKLEKPVLANLIENTAFTGEEIKMCYFGFKKHYPEGYILVQHFKEIYGSFYPQGDANSFAEHTFRIFDNNKDGKIDFLEFITGLSISTRGSFEEKLIWIFELYDSNSDGYISRDEMLAIVQSIMKMTTNVSIMPINKSIAKKRVDNIFKRNDKNADGLLTLEDFIDLGKSDPTLSKLLA